MTTFQLKEELRGPEENKDTNPDYDFDEERAKDLANKNDKDKQKKQRKPAVRIKPGHLIDPKHGLKLFYDATKQSKALERDDIDEVS